MSDAVFFDIQAGFDAVGDLRSSLEAAITFPTLEVPDVGVPAAMESLLGVSALAASLPNAIASQLGLIANAITEGAMDAIQADNPCINWNATPEA